MAEGQIQGKWFWDQLYNGEFEITEFELARFNTTPTGVVQSGAKFLKLNMETW